MIFGQSGFGIPPNAGPIMGYRFISVDDFTIADDAATSFEVGTAYGFGSNFKGAWLINRSGIASGGYGLFMFRVVASPAAGALVSGANLALSSGILSGTTGTDGKLTVAPHTDGRLYIENRLGGSANFSLTFF